MLGVRVLSWKKRNLWCETQKRGKFHECNFCWWRTWSAKHWMKGMMRGAVFWVETWTWGLFFLQNSPSWTLCCSVCVCWTLAIMLAYPHWNLVTKPNCLKWETDWEVVTGGRRWLSLCHRPPPVDNASGSSCPNYLCHSCLHEKVVTSPAVSSLSPCLSLPWLLLFLPSKCCVLAESLYFSVLKFKLRLEPVSVQIAWQS